MFWYRYTISTHVCNLMLSIYLYKNLNMFSGIDLDIKFILGENLHALLKLLPN
jgi:hypothetical protein